MFRAMITRGDQPTRRRSSAPVRERAHHVAPRGEDDERARARTGSRTRARPARATSVRDGSTPIAITTNAGTIVTSRRTVTGICRRMKPCITTWPESVPTAELERPEAISASAKSALEALPRIGCSVLCAPSSESTCRSPLREERRRRHHEHRDVDHAGDRHRDHDVDARVAEQRPRVLVGLRDERGPASAPSAGRSRAASRSRRGCRPRAAPPRCRRTAGRPRGAATAPRSGCANASSAT